MSQWLTKFAVGTMFALVTVLSVMANPADDVLKYLEGMSAYREGDYTKSLRILKELAEKGYPFAQSNLGEMYANGKGVPKDDAEAVNWYRKAAEQGYAEAQFNLGFMFANGHGVSKDGAQAVRWFRKAAEQGIAEAQYNLAVMCAHGRGTQKDYVEAVKWYRKAAEQGYADAQHSLGFLYFNGVGVLKDYVQAHIWWNLAASQGNDQAQKNRDFTERQMTPQQIAEAHRLAREWKPRMADAQGTPPVPQTPPQTAPVQPELAGSGTGFYVSAAGHVLTNAHVVTVCSSLGVEAIGKSSILANVVASDARNDLAVIETKERTSRFARFRASGVRQGEAVVVYGFPLPGTIASTGNATTGNVTALAGLRDDTRMLQISAPVQPGNSGGPLMDMTGAVVGVVVAKLNAVKVMEAVGDIPQNINFAIKANIAESFLESYGIEQEPAVKAKELSVPDVTESARAISVRVLCYR